MDENEVMLDEGWEEDSVEQAEVIACTEPLEDTSNGAPGKAEGFVGERTSSAMSKFSPQGGNAGYGACEDAVIAREPQEPPAPKPESNPPAADGGTPLYTRGATGSDLLQKFRDRARQQDMERFLRTFPGVQASAIPRQVWERVAGGESLVSAYTMHENQRLQAELAAERRNQLNRQRSPGSLGANVGKEMDELDRLWSDDD